MSGSVQEGIPLTVSAVPPPSGHLWDPDWDSLGTLNATGQLSPTAAIVTPAPLSPLSPGIRHTEEEGV